MDEILKQFEAELVASTSKATTTSSSSRAAGPVLAGKSTTNTTTASATTSSSSTTTTTTLEQLDYARSTTTTFNSSTTTLESINTLVHTQSQYFAKPTAAPSSSTDGQTSSAPIYKKKIDKAAMRKGAGKVWEDQSMEQWPENDFRLFCGDIGNEVTDELLKRTFNTYPSFARAHVVRDKKTGKSKGFGFVSFLNQEDYTKAFRDWNGKYVGNRPIKLKKSTWKDRALLQ